MNFWNFKPDSLDILSKSYVDLVCTHFAIIKMFTQDKSENYGGFCASEQKKKLFSWAEK